MERYYVICQVWNLPYCIGDKGNTMKISHCKYNNPIFIKSLRELNNIV